MAAWLAGCAKPDKQGLYTHYDNINGDTVDMIADNKLELPNENDGELWLNASQINSAKGGRLYHLEVHFISNVGWLQIEQGETLALVIDGQDKKYEGSGSANFRKQTGKGIFTEDAIYRVTASDLRRIATAKSIRVTVYGVKGSVTREFGPANLDKFKAFATTYLK